MAALTTEQCEQIESEIAAFNRLLTELGRPRELLRSIMTCDVDRDLADAGLRVGDARARILATAQQIIAVVESWPDITIG